MPPAATGATHKGDAMTFLNSVLDLDDHTRLETFREIVDALGDVRPDCEHVIDLSTFEPRLTDDGRVLARRTPLR